MRKVKAFAKAAWIVPLVGLVTTGCGTASGSGGTQNGKTVINFWYTWGGSGETSMQNLINEFNKSQNKIIVKGLSQGDEQKQMTAIVGHNPPDLASQYDQDNLASWASEGAMMPLDSFIKGSNYDTSDFLPAAMKAVQYSGQTYALPLAMNVWMLYYNKTLLKKAGISGPPQTMQELKADAKKLTKYGSNGELTQVGFQADTSPYMLMNSYGGKLWDPATNQVTPDNKGYQDALQFNQSLWQEYGVNNYDRFQSGESATGEDPFLVGKMAMSVNGEWEALAAKQTAPNLNYGIAPVPYDANQPSTKGSGFINVNILYIPKGSPHPQAAWEFMQWLEAKQQMVTFDAAIGNLTPRESTKDSSQITNIPGLKFALNYALGSKMNVLPQIPVLQEYLSELAKEEDNVYRGKESASQEAQKVKSTIQPMVQN